MSNQSDKCSLSNSLWEEILEFIAREQSIDGSLAERLLALCMNAAPQKTDDSADTVLPDELKAVLPCGAICEDAEEWDFIDPVISAKGGMREPLGIEFGGISQADIVSRMIDECKENPELAERLRGFLEKYL